MPNGENDQADMAEYIASLAPVPWQAGEFAVLVQQLVDSQQPQRIGAVVQILGDDLDAKVAGLVLDFGDDGAVAFGLGRDIHCPNLTTPENALNYFNCPPQVHNRLVWCGPAG